MALLAFSWAFWRFSRLNKQHQARAKSLILRPFKRLLKFQINLVHKPVISKIWSRLLQIEEKWMFHSNKRIRYFYWLSLWSCRRKKPFHYWKLLWNTLRIIFLLWSIFRTCSWNKISQNNAWKFAMKPWNWFQASQTPLRYHFTSLTTKLLRLTFWEDFHNRLQFYRSAFR